MVGGSPAERAGLAPGDEIIAVDGEAPRDVIRWQLLTDGSEVRLAVRRGGSDLEVVVAKGDGEPLGAELDAAVFDRVQTCDNHCEFCFIHQLPKGMRRSLYLKDDDYRLSFLYGNFTTLTRFTELDFERVVTERLSPLYVSIHAADPEIRARILQNRRGAVSLRWLRLLLEAGIEVHGQVVVCPGVNDGEVLADTFAGVLDRFSGLRTVGVVPLGVSRFNRQRRMRAHTRGEAAAVVDLVAEWQEVFGEALGRRMVFAADEYYVMCGREFPPADHYEGFEMHEDGIGMARTLELEFNGAAESATAPRSGFFGWVDGAPADGYRAPRQGSAAAVVAAPADGGGAGTGEADRPGPAQAAVAAPLDGGEAGTGEADRPGPAQAAVAAPLDGGEAGIGEADRLRPAQTAVVASLDSGGAGPVPVRLRPGRRAPAAVLTGTLGAAVVGPVVAALGRDDVRVVPVENRFFGGNIGVTGLMVGEDLARVLADEPAGHRYLLPDVCLSRGRFLDGATPADLPRPVEVVPTHGQALRDALTRP